MIAAEAPNSARTIVVAPPEDWSPSETLASDLLGETTTAPWLTPATLGSLSSAPDTQRTVPRQPPPASKASPGELSRGYLDQVRSLGAQLGVYKSMLYKPAAGLPAVTGSRPWSPRSRPPGAAAGWRRAWRWSTACPTTSGARRKRSRSSASAQVPDGRFLRAGPRVDPERAASGHRVRVVATVDNVPGRTSQLTIGRFPDVVIIPPQQAWPCGCRSARPRRDPPSSSLSLTSANGTPLTFTDTPLTVAVDQVRPGDPVPHRRRDRRPRAHLGVPRRPAVAARRHASRQRGGGPTG